MLVSLAGATAGDCGRASRPFHSGLLTLYSTQRLGYGHDHSNHACPVIDYDIFTWSAWSLFLILRSLFTQASDEDKQDRQAKMIQKYRSEHAVQVVAFLYWAIPILCATISNSKSFCLSQFVFSCTSSFAAFSDTFESLCYGSYSNVLPTVTASSWATP